MNEIDFLILEDGKLHRVEYKDCITFNFSSVKGFKCVENTKYILGTSGIIYNTVVIYPLEDNIFVFPIARD